MNTTLRFRPSVNQSFASRLYFPVQGRGDTLAPDRLVARSPGFVTATHSRLCNSHTRCHAANPSVSESGVHVAPRAMKGRYLSRMDHR